MLSLIILISSVAVNAQIHLPAGFTDYSQQMTVGDNPYSFGGATNKKWFFTTYSGIQTGLTFFNGGSATYLAAPLGLQLNRRLNKNYYAFAGISAAPAYINFNRSYLFSEGRYADQKNGLFNSGSLGAYSGVSLGLMYVNDAKTFSISGSFSVQNDSYPLFLPNQQMNAPRAKRVFVPTK